MTTGKPDDIREQAKRIYFERCDEVNRLAARFEEEEVIDLLARAILAAKAEEREACAAVADEREAICADAVVKVEAGELYAGIPTAAATERCARLEAAHIARLIRKRGEG